ncbi:MAG: CehA/McbA family metallohydrolase [Planctomycetota bacterium]|jgi:hypothetical protein
MHSFIKLLPEAEPEALGLKPLRINFNITNSRNFTLNYMKVSAKRCTLNLINPAGEVIGKSISGKSGKLNLKNPLQGEWEITLAGNEPELIRFAADSSSGIYCSPHTRAALTLQTKAPEDTVFFIEVPAAVDEFSFTASGIITAIKITDKAGKDVEVKPVNSEPYLASAKNRYFYKVHAKSKQDQFLKLKISHSEGPLTVAVRERLRFFFAKPPRTLPLVSIQVTTDDQDKNFLPCRINIFKGSQWWKAVYTSHRKQLLSLPYGRYTTQADHGYEYMPDRKNIEAGPNGPRKLCFTVKKGIIRPGNMYCGDNHMHTSVSDGSGTIEELYHAGLCNGLDWLAFTDHANRSYIKTCPAGMKLVKKLSGKNGVIGIPAVETDTHSPSNHYNAMNIKDFVHPEHVRINKKTGEEEFTAKSVKEVYDEVMAQDREGNPVICILNHPMHGQCEGEKVLTECRYFNVFEVSTGNHCLELKEKMLKIWFRLLNKGRRLSAVSGTDTHHFDHYPPGSERTYCYIKGRPTRKKIIEAMRDGHSICTWGPLLIDLQINGKIPGQTVSCKKLPTLLSVEASCQSLLPIDRLDIIFNGKVTESVTVEKDVSTVCQDTHYPINFSSVLNLNKKIMLNIKTSGWILMLAYLKGQEQHFAVTNPIYIEKK